MKLLLVFDYHFQLILVAGPSGNLLIPFIRVHVADLSEMLQTFCPLALNSLVFLALGILKHRDRRTLLTLASLGLPLLECLHLENLSVLFIVGLHFIGAFELTV